MKKCSKCGVEKALTEFGKKAQNKDGYRKCCRDCKKPTAGTLTKICSKCDTEKFVTEFHLDAGTASGLCCWCKVCQAAANHERLLKNPEKIRAGVRKSDLKRRFRLTPEGVEALIADQKGCCAVCKDPFSNSFNTHIDHIHGSSPVVVRGILCAQCNVGLGNFKDSPERLLNAAEYLKKFRKIA